MAESWSTRSAVEVLAATAMRPWWSVTTGATRDLVRCSLRDWFAVAVAGAAEPAVGDLASLVPSVRKGERSATVLALGLTASTAEAALVNGVAGHVLDYDDTTLGSLEGHPTAAVLPALLASAESSGLTVGAVLEAYTSGIQVANELGSWVNPEHYRAGWHATATVGSIGGAAATARLLDLSIDEVAAAISLATTQAAGVRASFGTMAKPLQVGRSASTAVYSARLASVGVRGPLDALSEHPGFTLLPGSSGRPTLPEVGVDGSAWLAVSQTIIKWHASCHGTHAALEAVALLRVPHDEVEGLEVGIRADLLDVCGIEAPRTPLELKFSTRGVVAMALAGFDTSDPASYSQSTLASESWHAAMQRVRVRSADLESEWQATISVQSRTGQMQTVSADLRRRLSIEQTEQGVAQKFERLVTPVLGASRADRLWRMLEEPDDQAVAEVMAAAAAASSRDGSPHLAE